MRASSPFRHKSAAELSKAKENLTVTVRFRPLSVRERKKGDEIAWYADGDSTVRNDSNPNNNIAYAFDHVFGPATTTRRVYDAAAHHAVISAMNGINATIFAYGVTSSGKTHTMHGVHKSPGIIPLAVKHVFEIIQETPGREFLLRVSYLEIYNEVINDLLDPTGQNLRMREDAQGTFIEGVKEEVVLSPAHALSLIATGEEHRHVGSNNFNLLSSRSHTIFTLTVESSPCGQSQGKEDVTLSQLHLIDLAGSESSKTETNGLRRKEGSYINKSLLTLGTVISKLTEIKATHIPYRDSKLTRLLQSSLSGYGRISLICTVTPASSNSEETHNTLKFAHRSKHVEINASQNKILDEKSLIKKYQKEISHLKQELQRLEHGTIETPCMSLSNEEGSGSQKLQILQKLEEEEQVKAALMGRIQRLTNLILVSTKSTAETSISEKAVYRKGQCVGEDELAYLPDEKREYITDCDVDGDGGLDSKVLINGCGSLTNMDETVKDNKKHARKGMLGWFKTRKSEHLVRFSAGCETSTSRSPVSCATPPQNKIMTSDAKEIQKKSVSMKAGDTFAMDSYRQSCKAEKCLQTTIGISHVPQTGRTIADHLYLLNEKVNRLAEEVAMCTSTFKRLSQQEVNNAGAPQAEDEIQKLKDEIAGKKQHIRQLEQCTIQSLITAPQGLGSYEMSQALILLAAKLSDKTCELEIKSADNMILQEQLELKISESSEMQGTIGLLRQQLRTSLQISPIYPVGEKELAILNSAASMKKHPNAKAKNSEEESGATTHVSISSNKIFTQVDSSDSKIAGNSMPHGLMQAAEIEDLKIENAKLAEEKDGLKFHSQKVAEEASWAKELAAAAAVELQHLTEEVTKLSYQNAELIGQLESVKEVHYGAGSCGGL